MQYDLKDYQIHGISAEDVNGVITLYDSVIKSWVSTQFSTNSTFSRKQRMGVLVPAYFSPWDDELVYWTTLIDNAKRFPNMLMAIANPDDGAGSSRDNGYVDIFFKFQDASGKILGYILTGYGTTAIATVKASIDNWYTLYPEIDGIFIDEMDNVEGAHESYYGEIYAYIKGKDANAIVVGNPGTGTTRSYMYYNHARICDIICTFESDYGAISEWVIEDWQGNYSRNNFYFLSYLVTEQNYQSVVDTAYNNNYKWIYLTTDNLPNPWDTLPAYFDDFCSYVYKK